MPKAEVGSVKHLSNKLKSKGLQRLRWYCQVCEKQCRDANGFKLHSQSESHVRQMLIVGEDPKKHIENFSNEFLKDFLSLLKTGHGEKQVHINHFYNTYIANKEHIHMNATKWHSLTDFAQYLGKQGICRVEENEKGIHISWIDDSPEAIRGTRSSSSALLREQIKRAQANSAKPTEEANEEDRELKRDEGEKIKLSFGAKPAAETAKEAGDKAAVPGETEVSTAESTDGSKATAAKPSGFGGISMKLGGGKPQTKNVFSQAKKNAFSTGSKKGGMAEQPKKISEAERIMKEEMERKRSRETAGFGMPSSKKHKGK
uniref:C2H2-type domain-containing protein n=1 Tax=Bionectria ochroleuca TaxID=29856 RepID=A0A8H7NGD1_BIOOC